MRLLRFAVIVGAALVVAPASAGAQWLKLPTPGIPRLPDGKPNLGAPAPRTPDGKPDLSGIWRNGGGDRLNNNIAADLQPGEVAPWAEAIYQKRRLEFGKNSMDSQCLPLGPAYLTSRYHPFRITQTSALVSFLHEDMAHREIFMDGRSLEPDPNPTWMGYSVGHWEGDTLVVESNGYTDRSWLDFDGHPHTEALRITERYTRRDFGHMEVRVTMVDPTAYLKPITFTMPIGLRVDEEMLEYVCENNARSRERFASTPPARAVDVPVSTLADYVGVYDVVDEYNGDKAVATVTLSGATLFLDYAGKGKEALIPLGPTRFLWSGSIVDFSSSPDGQPYILFRYAESNEQGPRRR